MSYGMGIIYSKLSLENDILVVSSKVLIQEPVPQEQALIPPKSDIVGAKTGKKYYFIWCSGVSRIKPENLIYFESVEDAENRGYEKAQNCENTE